MDEFNILKLENQVCFPLYVCSKELVNKYKLFLGELDLTYTQYITMLVLWENGEITVTELGKKLFLDSGTLTPLLKKLELKGYIVRSRSKKDERNLNIKLTNKGLDLKTKVKKVPSKIMNCVNLTNEEAITLYKLLYKVIDELKK